MLCTDVTRESDISDRCSNRAVDQYCTLVGHVFRFHRTAARARARIGQKVAQSAAGEHAMPTPMGRKIGVVSAEAASPAASTCQCLHRHFAAGRGVHRTNPPIHTSSDWKAE